MSRALPALFALIFAVPLLPAAMKERLAESRGALSGVVLAVGGDWCVSGEQVRRTYESREFRSILGAEFLFGIWDRREKPGDAAWADACEFLRGLDCGTRRFPAIFLYDGKGRRTGVAENLPARISPADLAACVQRLRAGQREADRLFAERRFGEGLELLSRQCPGLLRADRKKGWVSDIRPEAVAALRADPSADAASWLLRLTMDDGIGFVSAANGHGLAKSREAGEKFIAELRGKPARHLTVEQRQSFDMAEFAFRRHDPEARARCLDLLRDVFAQCPTSFWGWAAHGYLGDFGETVEAPAAAPLTDETGRGIVDYQLRRLKAVGVNSRDDLRVAKAGEADVTRLLAGRGGPRQPTPAETRSLLRFWTVRTVGIEALRRVLAHEGGRDFVTRFMGSDEWMDEFLASGPVTRPACAFSMLATIIANDAAGWSLKPLGRRVATALALNAAGEDEALRAVRAYLAYRHLADRGRLHRRAYALSVREWRFVLRTIPAADDILYLNAFANLPQEDYGGVCWSVPYRSHTCFGESVQRPLCYRPWAGIDWPSQKLRSRVGAVCEGLSAFGALAANAHGLLATTGGQPGHCAYMRRTDAGRWMLHYNIAPFTQPHYCFYRGGFTELDVIERAFADPVRQRTSDHSVWLAHLAEDRKMPFLQIDALYRRAVRIWTKNIGAWRDYGDWLRRTGADDARLNVFLHALARALPDGRQLVWNEIEACLAVIVRRPGGRGRVVNELTQLYAKLPQPPDGSVNEEMDFRAALDRHAKLVGDDFGARLRLLESCLRANFGRSCYFGAAMRWGTDFALKDPDVAHVRDFLRVLERVYAACTPKGSRPDIDLGPLALTASRAGNVGAFRAVSDLNDRLFPPDRRAKSYPSRDYGASLVGSTGLLQTSSISRWDNPEFYARVLDETGFADDNIHYFHTGVEATPWARVVLAEPVRVKGVTLVNRYRNRWNASRQVGAKVAVSVDGKAWMDVGELTELKSEYRFPVDVTESVKYVKVYRPDGVRKGHFHLQKILVYGDREDGDFKTQKRKDR